MHVISVHFHPLKFRSIGLPLGRLQELDHCIKHLIAVSYPDWSILDFTSCVILQSRPSFAHSWWIQHGNSRGCHHGQQDDACRNEFPDNFANTIPCTIRIIACTRVTMTTRTSIGYLPWLVLWNAVLLYSQHALQRCTPGLMLGFVLLKFWSMRLMSIAHAHLLTVLKNQGRIIKPSR